MPIDFVVHVNTVFSYGINVNDEDDQKALFADVRASIDDVLKNKEKAQKQLNTGLGFRSVIANNKVFGLYGFYDNLKTGNGNKFGNITTGVEFLSPVWELKHHQHVFNKIIFHQKQKILLFLLS